MPIVPVPLVTPLEKIATGGSPINVAVQALSTRVGMRIDGTDHSEFDALMVEWLIEERINQPARFELLVQNQGPAGLRYDDRRVFEFGKVVEVNSAGGDSLFKGFVVAISDEFDASTAPRARLVAADRLERLAATRRSRIFTRVSDKDVIQRVASEHGLFADVNLNTLPVRSSISQFDCSDLDFLRQLAERCNARLRMDDTRLIAERFDNPDPPAAAFTLGHELQSFSVSADLRGQPTSVSVGAWSVATGGPINANATPNPAEFDVPGGDSGAAIRQSAFGSAVFTLASSAAGNGEEATLQARALMATRARGFVSASGRLGTLAAGVHAGSVVTLAGLGSLHSGRYRITALRRRFNPAQGSFTEFEAQRNSIGRP